MQSSRAGNFLGINFCDLSIVSVSDELLIEKVERSAFKKFKFIVNRNFGPHEICDRGMDWHYNGVAENYDVAS